MDKTSDILEGFEDYASDYTSSSADDSKNSDQIDSCEKVCASWLEKPTLEVCHCYELCLHLLRKTKYVTAIFYFTILRKCVFCFK